MTDWHESHDPQAIDWYGEQTLMCTQCTCCACCQPDQATAPCEGNGDE